VRLTHSGACKSAPVAPKRRRIIQMKQIHIGCRVTGSSALRSQDGVQNQAGGGLSGLPGISHL
jgi:hypothetical protein